MRKGQYRMLRHMTIAIIVIITVGQRSAFVQEVGTHPPLFRFAEPDPTVSPREAPLRFTEPDSCPCREVVNRGAAWLLRHVVYIESKDDPEPLALIAWWDPTLSNEPGDLVAYTLTDTLWAGWALRSFSPEIGAQLCRSLDRLHSRSNGFMDQPFHVLTDFKWNKTDADRDHGAVLGTAFPVSGAQRGGREPPRQIQVRAMHFRRGSEKGEREFVNTFVDAAVYYAFHLFWNGEEEKGRDMLINCLVPDSGLPIQYDPELGVLLDAADEQAHEKLSREGHQTKSYAPFKQALFLFASRQLGLIGNGVPPDVADRLTRRIIEAQNSDGGFCHSVVLDQEGVRCGPPHNTGATGETTAICLLALLSKEAANESRKE